MSWIPGSIAPSFPTVNVMWTAIFCCYLPFCEAITFPKVLCSEALVLSKSRFQRKLWGSVWIPWPLPSSVGEPTKWSQNWEKLWGGETGMGGVCLEKVDPWGVPSKGFLSWPFPICYSGSCSPWGEEFYLSKPLCYDCCLSRFWKIWLQLTMGQNL